MGPILEHSRCFEEHINPVSVLTTPVLAQRWAVSVLTTPVLAQRWAVWSKHNRTKNTITTFLCSIRLLYSVSWK